jgi:outer membrane protein, heavy metal efflux system
MTAIICIFMLATAEVNPPEFSAANDELRGYVMEAGENSPALKALHAEWQAALKRVPQATSLDDPMFSLGYFLQSDMNQFKIMLAQKFPWFGTRRLRGEKEAVLADAALETFYDERNRIFAEVKRAYFDLAFLGESIRVTESQLEVLAYMEDIVRTKLEVGMANDDELLRISIEKTKVQDRQDGFVQFTPAMTARLNEAMGAEASLERPWPETAQFPSELPPNEEILKQIQTANPGLKRFDHLIENRRKQAQLAKKKGRPDFTIGLEYAGLKSQGTMRPDRFYPSSLNSANRVVNTLSGTTPFTPANAVIDMYALSNSNEPMRDADDRKDNVMISLKLNLPIWRKKIKAGITEAQLMEKATIHAKRRKELDLQEGAVKAVFEVNDGQRRFKLFEDSLIPQAKATYESLQSQYATGAVSASFLDVLDSIQTLLAFELEQVRAARDWQVGAANLEYLIGGPWNTAMHNQEN